MTIKQHSPQAKYYQFRTPYVPELFAQISAHLKLNSQSRLLDLCCGCGELASGFLNYAGEIYAVDGSQDMLRCATRDQRIQYFCADVNSTRIKLPQTVDHIVIGRAIHWLSPDSLSIWSEDHLQKGGSITVASTQWSTTEPWLEVYQKIVTTYRPQEIRARTFDYTGSNTLQGLGLKSSQPITVQKRLEFDLEYLVYHTLSESYDAHLQNLERSTQTFKDQIFSYLSPYSQNGKLSMDVLSWALVYSYENSFNRP